VILRRAAQYAPLFLNERANLEAIWLLVGGHLN
jgi:hypothetical protein